MTKKFQCKRFRSVKKSTLAKESCDNLWERLECYGIGKMETIEGKRVRQTVVPYIPSDPSTDTPIGRAFTNTIETIAERTCPKVTTNVVLEQLEVEFPTHRFKRHYNTIQIPQSFTPDEIEELNNKLDRLSSLNYRLQYNNRLNRYYISPKSKKQLKSIE